MGRPITLLFVALAVAAAGVPPARAQASDISVVVASQPVWHDADDALDLEVRVTNEGPEPVEGYIITVAAHGRILSRSELHESFDAATTFEASLITAIEAPDEEIPAGGETVRTISDPVASLQSLALSTESGVYPLTISVLDSAGTLVATTTTQLIYYPTPPEFRLPAVPVIPIADLPRRAPDGTFRADEGRFALAEASQRRGWLTGLIGALDRATTTAAGAAGPPRRGRGRAPDPQPLAAAVVVMPRLAEELSDMADGYRLEGVDEPVAQSDPTVTRAQEIVASLREIAGRDTVQSLLAPYSFPDFPTMFDRFEDAPAIPVEHIEQQLREAEAVLTESLGRAPSRRWVFSPGGRLDQVSLERLQQLQSARFTFFGEDSLEPLEDPAGGGCPEAPLSFTCAISVTTSVGRTRGYVLDPGIQQRIGEIARGEGGRAAIQRFFAETAVIREEVPSRTDRAVVIALPGIWQPPPWTTTLLIEGLRDVPWLRTHTPRRGLSALAREIDPVERRIRSVTPRLANQPDEGYIEAIIEADEVVDAFRGIQPPPSLLQRLSRNALVSESRFWWREPELLIEGERYASDAADEAEDELGKVTIGGSNEIALTSRSAQVPVVIFNDNSYEVSISVRLASADLNLDETFPITVQANGLRQLTVDVAAQSSGIFPLLVTVETPDGTEITEKSIQIRSTEFNEIALGLTFGALAFLILFYVTRAVRGRRTKVESTG